MTFHIYLYSMERNCLCNFGRVNCEEQFCENHFEFGSVVPGMQFKDISYLELWWPLCSVDQSHLDQWFRRKCCLDVFLIWSSGSPFVQRSGSIGAISVEGIMRNNSVK